MRQETPPITDFLINCQNYQATQQSEQASFNCLLNQESTTFYNSLTKFIQTLIQALELEFLWNVVIGRHTQSSTSRFPQSRSDSYRLSAVGTSLKRSKRNRQGQQETLGRSQAAEIDYQIFAWSIVQGETKRHTRGSANSGTLKAQSTLPWLLIGIVRKTKEASTMPSCTSWSAES